MNRPNYPATDLTDRPSVALSSADLRRAGLRRSLLPSLRSVRRSSVCRLVDRDQVRRHFATGREVKYYTRAPSTPRRRPSRE